MSEPERFALSSVLGEIQEAGCNLTELRTCLKKVGSRYDNGFEITGQVSEVERVRVS